MKNNLNHDILAHLIEEDSNLKRKGNSLTKARITELYPEIKHRMLDAYYYTVHSRITVADIVTLDGKLRAKDTVIKELRSKIKNVLKDLEKSEETIDFLYAIRPDEETVLKELCVVQTNSENNEMTAVAVIGDIHFEKEIKPKHVNYYNKTNPDINEKRLWKLFYEIVELTRMHRNTIPVKNLIIALNGDLIQGHLREDDLLECVLSPIEAANELWKILAAGIKYVADKGEFESIIVSGVVGNHARETKRKSLGAYAFKQDKEWGMLHNMKYYLDSLGYTQIEWLIPEDMYSKISVYNWEIVHSHGDHFRYNQGVGGISPALLKWRNRQDKIMPANLRYINHWHHENWIENVIINNCVCGYDTFAKNMGFKPEEPSQVLHYIHNRSLVKGAFHRVLLDSFYVKRF